MRIRSAVALTVLLLAPAAVAAQAPGVDLKLVPKVGYFVPLADLADADGVFEDVGNKMKSSFAIGLAAELDLPLLPVDIRANMEYATSSGLEDIENADATLLALTGDLVFRPLPTPVIQPFLIGGAGIKKYDWDLDGADDPSDFTLHLGAGLDVGFGPLALTAEVSDYISWYETMTSNDTSESKMQNDVFVMVGIRVGMF